LKYLVLENIVCGPVKKSVALLINTSESISSQELSLRERNEISSHQYCTLTRCLCTTGATGYPLTAGAGYTLQTQSSMGSPVPMPSSSQAGSQYPTYIGSQFAPIQISPSQNPYAASATGHPLYPSNPYAGLQLQASQVSWHITF